MPMTNKLMLSILLSVLVLLPGLASAGVIAVNEVQANPRESTNKTAYQWFELYNGSDAPVTLQGWTVWNRDGSDVIPAVTIPAKGFAVVAANEASFRQKNPGYIGILVSLDGTIGSGLADGYFDPAHIGDLLCLKDGSGAIVDRLNWGNVDPSWANIGLAPWQPAGAAAVSPTHVLGRYPDGAGSGAVGDWRDFANLSPGKSNPAPGTGFIAPTTWGKIKALYSEKYHQMFL